MYKIILLFSFFLTLGFSLRGQQIPAPDHLRTDLLLNSQQVSNGGLVTNVSLENAVTQTGRFQFPRIVSERPVFSWEVDTLIRGVSAYRILVASSEEQLRNDKADVWDSKKVTGNRNSVRYNGKSLEAGKIYHWKVQVWDKRGRQSPFSKLASVASVGESPDEPFSHYPLAAEMQTALSIHKIGNDAYFLDFGKDALAQISLHLTSQTADTIWVEAGELTDGSLSIHKNPGRNIRYIKIPLYLKPGTHDYKITWPQNEKRNSRNPILMPAYIGEVYPFRYVAVHHYKGRLDKSAVSRKIVFYPFNQQASTFTSSDTTLNQVWDLCKYSIKATSFAGYYIDGDRERIPYEADALINQLSHYAVDGEYSMARRTMNYLLFHPTWPTEWSLQNVLIAWNDYMYTGEKGLLTQYYPELQKKMLTTLAGTNGLISTRTGKQTDAFLASVHMNKNFDGRRGLHDNVDWPQTGEYIGSEKEYKGETDGFVYNNYNAVVNAYYYRNLVLMEKIALALNKPEDAENYARKRAGVYNAFQKVFRDPATGLIRDGDSTEHTSLHANMFALAFGLVQEKNRKKVIDFIKSRKMACSVYGAQFLLDALYESGEGQYGLELLTAHTQRSWYNMIRSGSTITMEAWDKVYKPNLDLNHAWGAAPANLIVRQLAGVKPLVPGFEHIQIKPQWGNLSHASLTTPTVKGPVSVSFDRRGGFYSMEVIVPGGTTADVYVPGATGKAKLLVNGRSVVSEKSGDFFVLKKVRSGKHNLLVR